MAAARCRCAGPAGRRPTSPTGPPPGTAGAHPGPLRSRRRRAAGTSPRVWSRSVAAGPPPGRSRGADPGRDREPDPRHPPSGVRRYRRITARLLDQDPAVTTTTCPAGPRWDNRLGWCRGTARADASAPAAAAGSTAASSARQVSSSATRPGRRGRRAPPGPTRRGGGRCAGCSTIGWPSCRRSPRPSRTSSRTSSGVPTGPRSASLWPLEQTVAHLNHGSYGASPCRCWRSSSPGGTGWRRTRSGSSPASCLARWPLRGRGRPVPRCRRGLARLRRQRHERRRAPLLAVLPRLRRPRPAHRPHLRCGPDRDRQVRRRQGCGRGHGARPHRRGRPGGRRRCPRRPHGPDPARRHRPRHLADGAPDAAGPAGAGPAGARRGRARRRCARAGHARPGPSSGSVPTSTWGPCTSGSVPRVGQQCCTRPPGGGGRCDPWWRRGERARASRSAFDDTGTEDPDRVAVGTSGTAGAFPARPGAGRDGTTWARRRRSAGGRTGARGARRPDLPRDAAVSMQLVPLPDGIAATRDQAAALQDRIGADSAVEVAVTSWAGRGFLRLSAHVYNAPADYRRLAADLPSLSDLRSRGVRPSGGSGCPRCSPSRRARRAAVRPVGRARPVRGPAGHDVDLSRSQHHLAVVQLDGEGPGSTRNTSSDSGCACRVNPPTVLTTRMS